MATARELTQSIEESIRKTYMDFFQTQTFSDESNRTIEMAFVSEVPNLRDGITRQSVLNAVYDTLQDAMTGQIAETINATIRKTSRHLCEIPEKHHRMAFIGILHGAVDTVIENVEDTIKQQLVV
jgi:hypothetical protein